MTKLILGYFSAILLINYLVLVVHNPNLALAYVLLVVSYVLLNSPWPKWNKFNLPKGVATVFIDNKFSGRFFAHWLVLVDLPLFITLYYMDFALLLSALFINSVLVILIYRGAMQ